MTNDTGIYVTGVVIANGLPDHEGDILNKKDIKIIHTKYLEHDSDVQHNYIKNKGVQLLDNWISEVDTDIDGKIAPAGSWLATFYVTNTDIIESIKSSDPKSINGLSLGSIPKTIDNMNYWFINKSINYRDVNSTEEVIPKFISFVARPSNGFGLLVEDYAGYINKSASQSEDEIMVNENPQEEKLSLSGWERVVKGLQSLGINKSETGATEPKTETKVEPVKEEPEVKDISNKELLEKIPDAVATGMVSAFEKMGEAKQEPVEPINKEETEPVKKEEPVEAEPVKEEVTEPAQKTKEEAISKSATSKHENIQQPNASTNFYKKSGRDMWGCRIRK